MLGAFRCRQGYGLHTSCMRRYYSLGPATIHFHDNDAQQEAGLGGEGLGRFASLCILLLQTPPPGG